MQGFVKWFKNDKGFGFIAGDDGVEYFLHRTNVDANLIEHRTRFVLLNQTDRVEFEVEETKKGLAAIRVRKANG